MRLALYTTVYPAVLPLFSVFYASVQAQRDRDFDLWIGLDQVEPEQLSATLGRGRETTLVPAPAGSTPTAVRIHALARLVAAGYDGVVLADSDDLLLPTRIGAARRGLERYDLVGCALDLIDSSGCPLGARFGWDDGDDWARLELDSNVFGFSNSAYRCEWLAAGLRAPDDVVTLDWYCAFLALARGATAGFDMQPHMAYRQHGTNVAKVRPPFSDTDLTRGASLVAAHYAAVSGQALATDLAAGLAVARERVDEFQRLVLADPEAARRYLDTINTMKPVFRWWEWIANRRLEDTWRR